MAADAGLYPVSSDVRKRMMDRKVKSQDLASVLVGSRGTSVKNTKRINNAVEFYDGILTTCQKL